MNNLKSNNIKPELIAMGMSARLKGTDYIARAIELYSTNVKITGEGGLYGVIASEYRDTHLRVERSIRHSIEELFIRIGTDEVVRRIEKKFNIAIPVSDWEKKPSNSEFIAILNLGIIIDRPAATETV